MKKLLALLIVFVMVFATMAMLTACSDDPDDSDEDEDEEELEEAYEEAMELLEEKEYDKALKAFKKLDDYEDSEKQVKKLEKWQEDYDAAVELMENGDYEAAKEAFEALGDYRDSEELLKKAIPYEEAMDTYDDAESVGEFLAVAAVFEELSGYRDADTMASMAYLNVCRIHLIENNDPETAMEYMDRLNDEHYEGFQQVLKDYCADSTVLEDMEYALQARSDYAEYTDPDDYEGAVRTEWNIIGQYRDRVYADSTLQGWIEAYLDVLQEQLACVEDYGYPTDYVQWYEICAKRCEIITELYYEYGFLQKNETLAMHYVEKAPMYTAYAEIEDCLEAQMWGVVPSQDSYGAYYLSFTNTTGYDFTVEFLQQFGLDGYIVYEEYNMSCTIDIKSGETVHVPLNFPDYDDYNEWYIDWVFYDVYNGNTFLD